MRGLCIVLAVIAVVKEGVVFGETSVGSASQQVSDQEAGSEPSLQQVQQKRSDVGADDDVELNDEELSRERYFEYYGDEPVDCTEFNLLNQAVKDKIDEDRRKKKEKVKAEVRIGCPDTENAMRYLLRSSGPFPQYHVYRNTSIDAGLSPNVIAERLWNGGSDAYISDKLQQFLKIAELTMTFGCASSSDAALCAFSLPENEEEYPPEATLLLAKFAEKEKKEQDAAARNLESEPAAGVPKESVGPQQA